MTKIAPFQTVAEVLASDNPPAHIRAIGAVIQALENANASDLDALLTALEEAWTLLEDATIRVEEVYDGNAND